MRRPIIAILTAAVALCAPPGRGQTNVVGMTAPGTAPTGAGQWPVLCGYLDGSGLIQALTGSGGALNVNASFSGAVSTGVAQGSTTPGQLNTLMAGAVTTSQPAYTNGQTSPISLTPGGNLRISDEAIKGVAVSVGNGTTDAGTQRVTISSDSTGVIGAAQSGTWTVQPGNTINTTPWLVTPSPSTSGGSTPTSVNTGASTNATSTKGSAGEVISLNFGNSGAGWAYVKFYNKASAPTVGTDTPLFIVGVPPGGTTAWHDEYGTPFSTGIGYAVTGGAANSDTTAVAANQVVGLFTYK